MSIKEDQGEGSVKIHPQAIQQLFEATELQRGSTSFLFFLREKRGQNVSRGRGAGEGYELARLPERREGLGEGGKEGGVKDIRG